MTKAENSAGEVTAEFSVIKLFALVEEAVSAINTFPLTAKNLVIQQDMYKRLAGVGDETGGYEHTEPFAVLDCSLKERDSDMRFAIEFYAWDFVLSMEGSGSFSFVYEEFKNEQDGAEQLIACLKLLANGQIANLITIREGRTCATETLLYEPHNRTPMVIGTDGKYPWWWRGDDPSGYDTQLLRNQYFTERLAIPESLFLVQRTTRGKLVPRGRIFHSPELTPLLKSEFTFVTAELNMRAAGKQAGQSDWSFFYKSWEFWLAIVLFVGLLFGGRAIGIVPKFVTDHPPLTWPVAIFLIYLLLVPLLRRKQYLLEAHPDHPWVRFDHFLRGRSNTKEVAALSSESATTTKPSDSVQAQPHASRWLTVLSQLQIVVSYASALALYASGQKFKPVLTQSMFDHGSPNLLIHSLTAAAILLALCTLVYQLGLISSKLFGWLSYLGVFALFAGIALSINNRANGGPSTPWLLLFGGGFSQIIITAVRGAGKNRHTNRALAKILDKER